MPNALTHFCQACDWHETQQALKADTYTHCPRCRSSRLSQRAATRLELIAARFPPMPRCKRHPARFALS